MKKGLWLNRGLSFRFGRQFSREVGVSWTVVPQKKAFESHINLIKHIENNFDTKIDVIIDTFKTQYNEIFFQYYDSHCIEYNFLDKMDHGLPWAFNRAVFRVADRLTDYDYFIISRHDLLYKNEFLNCVNPNDDEIKYMFDMPFFLKIDQNSSIDRNIYKDEVIMVNDNFFYFPKQYFDAINLFRLSHGDNHDFLLNTLDKMPHVKISPYITTLHDSDSYKGWNPLYKIINRIEAKRDLALFPEG